MTGVRRTALLLAIVALFAVRAAGQRVYVTVDCSRSSTTLFSKAAAKYLDYFGNIVSDATITGFHFIGGTDGSTPAFETVSSSSGVWAGTIAGPGRIGVCYRGRIDASAFSSSQGAGSALVCIPAPPPPPPPGSTCREPLADGICPPTGSTCLPEDTTCQLSPIVLNLGNGGYDLTGSDDPVAFDLDADGQPDLVAWTAPNAPMAFLALDRNRNMVVDDGSELFGDATPLGSGKAANGFEALRAEDRNGDGVIDAADPVWTLLVLWVDANHDGVSQPSELAPLSTTDVSTLELDYHWTGRRDRSGNTFRYEAKVRRERRVVSYYDVFFGKAH